MLDILCNTIHTSTSLLRTSGFTVFQSELVFKMHHIQINPHRLLIHRKYSHTLHEHQSTYSDLALSNPLNASQPLLALQHPHAFLPSKALPSLHLPIPSPHPKPLSHTNIREPLYSTPYLYHLPPKTPVSPSQTHPPPCVK